MANVAETAGAAGTVGTVGTAGALDTAGAFGTAVATDAGRVRRRQRGSRARDASHREHPGHLPAQLTRFVGRKDEIARARALLGRTRLLTLSGAGGIGKTRLALEVAAAARAAFRDGTWFVDLTPIADPGLVPRVAAAALGIGERPGVLLEDDLVRGLRHKHLLLVLDNCEHVVASCASLADRVLRACPEVRVLATSREPLGIAGETIWGVPSLSFPDTDRPPQLEALAGFAAIELFLDRTAAALPDFALTPRNAARVVELCRRLDGIPLAIELAAARVRAFGVDQIVERLDDRFRLLTGGSRTAPPRHRTLEAAIAWSYELLPEQEQVLFRRLSAFAGAFDVDAAEGVCAGDGVAAGEVLDLMARLVEKSLVVAETAQHGATRYRLLETLRRYAADRLDAAGEADAARRHHAAWCLARAELHTRLVRDGATRREGLAALEREHDELRAALEWCHQRAPETGLRLACALHAFWEFGGHLREGRGWLERFAALAEPHPHLAGARARAVLGAGDLARRQGDYPAARAILERGLAGARRLTDAPLLVETLNGLGLTALLQGDGAAAAYLGESVALARGTDDPILLTRTLIHAGLAAHRHGDGATARALLEEGLSTARTARRRGTEGLAAAEREALLAQAHPIAPEAEVLGALGHVALEQGDLAGARALLEERLAVNRHVGDVRSVGLCHGALAIVAIAEGDLTGARARLAEGLDTAPGAGGVWAYFLACYATLAAAEGDTDKALRLAGAAEAQRLLHGPPYAASMQLALDAMLARIRQAHAGAAHSAAWEEGRNLPIEAALADARSSGVPEDTGAPARAPSRSSPLTSREREVAALLAEGRTSREIAAALVISERTAEAHVDHIRDKLGVRTRAQIAAWAVRRVLASPRPDGDPPAGA